MKVYNEQPKDSMHKELQDLLEGIRFNKGFDAKDYIDAKADLLNRYMKKCGLKACVVAVSGGIDSAVVLGIVDRAALCDDSPIEKVVPLLLPIFESSGVTNQNEATDKGKKLCKKLGLKPFIIDLSKINNEISSSVENVLGIKGGDWAVGQLGPYSRTPVLYFTTSLLSQEGLSAIICGTTNRDEGAYLGYVGKASDGMVDVQLISDIHKSEVYKVAKELGVPQSIIDAKPTGDMYDNREDTEVFGAPYDFVELYLNYLNKSKIDQGFFKAVLSKDAVDQFNFYANNLEKLHKYNSHKYLSKSPAVHLDLWDSSVKGGWDNYYEVIERFMAE